MELLTMLSPYIGEGLFSNLMTLVNTGTGIYDIGKIIYSWLQTTFHKEIKNKISERLNNVSNLQKHKRIEQLKKMRPVNEKDLQNETLNLENLRKMMMKIQKEKNENINKDVEESKKVIEPEQIKNSLANVEHNFRSNNNNEDIKNLSFFDNKTVIKPSPLLELRERLFGHNNKKITELDKIHNENRHKSKIPVLKRDLLERAKHRNDSTDLFKTQLNLNRFQKVGKRI
jgi:hypothetical protein